MTSLAQTLEALTAKERPQLSRLSEFAAELRTFADEIDAGKSSSLAMAGAMTSGAYFRWISPKTLEPVQLPMTRLSSDPPTVLWISASAWHEIEVAIFMDDRLGRAEFINCGRDGVELSGIILKRRPE